MTPLQKPKTAWTIPHAWIGLIIIVGAEILLFSGNRFVGGWFTPIVWTGYTLLMDGLVYAVHRRSLLTTDRLELLIVIAVSIASWWMFEFYNSPRFWRSDLELWWHYHNLEPNPYLRRVGYDWAFATICPAMFITAQFLLSTVFSRLPPVNPVSVERSVIVAMITFGAFAATMPLVFVSEWFAAAVWLSFILLLDPINFLRGEPSILGDIRAGNFRRLCSLLAAGGICGVMWEFWNYWAISKWTYTVPFFGNYKIFEMPVLGYLGFPPFAVECWVIYIFCRSLLQRRTTTDSIWFESAE